MNDIMRTAVIGGVIFLVTIFSLLALSERDVNNAEESYYRQAEQVARLQIASSNVNVRAQNLQNYQQNISGMLNTLIGLRNPQIDNILIQGGVRVVDKQGNQTFPPILTVVDTATIGE